MNRLLVYLNAESPRERRRRHLLKLAAQLESLIDCEGVELYVSRGDDDEGECALCLCVCADWRLEFEETFRAECCEVLEELQGRLASAVARLEGGAA